MHILDEIVAYKKEEVAKAKIIKPISALEKGFYFDRSCHSLKASICDPSLSGVIAEFKRKSPSKSDINLTASITDVTLGYQNAKASGISILTDEHFFGGKKEFLKTTRSQVGVPVLRKDFIIDEYQIIEAKAIGADAILLIARILTSKEMNHLSQLARSIGLEVLVEIHNEEELQKIPTQLDVIGINNRDLDTFKVDYHNSIQLLGQLPPALCKISESGIHNVDTMLMLWENGFDGFLIGESFMSKSDPGAAASSILTSFTEQRSLRDES